MTKVKAPQRTMLNVWKVKRPTTLSVPSWGPVVIEGHVLLELLLEPDSPMAQGGPWECV